MLAGADWTGVPRERGYRISMFDSKSRGNTVSNASEVETATGRFRSL